MEMWEDIMMCNSLQILYSIR